jgi:signal transduction histidine kinase/CHASE1-domain containing sensor protein
MTFFNICRVLFIYLLLGAIGISFAIAPGYASPIFPAAGYAISVMLWSNGRIWPGIWLGSFALNLGISWVQGDWNWHSGLIAAGIASGSTLQAGIARRLVLSKVQNGWRTLESERDIIHTLTLAGPVACILSATVGISILYSANIISAQGIIQAWLNWWSGDMLGVLVVMPISLALIYRREAPWSSRLTTQVVPMLFALSLLGAAFYSVAYWERSEQKQTIQAHGEAMADLLKQRFIAHQEALAALCRLIEVTPDMNYAQFEHFTAISLIENTDIFALSFNPFVQQSQRELFEQNMRKKTGLEEFEIKERDNQSRLIKVQDRPYYLSVAFIAPMQGNKAAIGYDINSEPVRHEAIQRAINSRKPSITSPIKLVQENQQRVGVLLLHPAYLKTAKGNQFASNNSFLGFAVGVIKVDEMVDIAVGSAMSPGLIFQVNDYSASHDHATVYQSETHVTGLAPEYTWQTQIAIADRIWTLQVTPTKAYLQQNPHLTALLVGFAGLVLATLLQMLLLITTGRTAIFQAKVEEQTAELQSKTDNLEDINEQLSALFALSPDGFVSFDGMHKVKFISPAFTHLTGLNPSLILGLDENQFSQKLADLCLPSARFSGIESLKSDVKTEANPHHQMEIIELGGQASRVLQVGLRFSTTGTVSQVLYFHDITHESKVDRLKSEFLSTAAHELRTPMASIFGFTELLLSQKFDETTQNELLSIIHDQSKLMANLINELLDLARIEARQGKDFFLEKINLEELLVSTLSGYKIPDNHLPAVITKTVLPLYVLADPNKVRQAIINLLSNAYKYSLPEKEVRISLISPIDYNDRFVGIEIRDHGIGMTPEQLARATERFYRADNSGAILGAGLGLSIVKEIAELQGGALSIASEYGFGTTATIWLPQAAEK